MAADALPPPDPVLARLAAHVAARLPAVADAYARHAAASGLVITRGDGSEQPIPLAALPVVLDDDAIARRAAVAARLVAANAKVAAWRLARGDRADCLGALGEAERRLVQACEHQGDRLAVTRVDYLPGARLHALEINATIPAMQGYSDLAAAAWLRHFAADPARLDENCRDNGRNADALFDALCAAQQRWRGHPPDAIGLLCRRGDAQLGELRHLRDRFASKGVHACLLHPDQLAWRDGYLQADGRRWPLVYRHLFLSRLDAAPCPPLESALAEPPGSRTLVVNAPAPQHEMKSTLAWLSRAGDDDALAQAIGLDEDARACVREVLPWTRLLGRGLEREPLHRLERIRLHPADYVLKRAWSYGGHDVFVGRACEDERFWRRVQRGFPGVKDWRRLVDAALADPRGGGFVVQQAIHSPSQRQWLCTPDGVTDTEVTTDYSAFASPGFDVAWTGVCRAAADPVVNLVGGGGLVPLLRRRVVEQVLARVAG